MNKNIIGAIGSVIVVILAFLGLRSLYKQFVTGSLVKEEPKSNQIDKTEYYHPQEDDKSSKFSSCVDCNDSVPMEFIFHAVREDSDNETT